MDSILLMGKRFFIYQILHWGCGQQKVNSKTKKELNNE